MRKLHIINLEKWVVSNAYFYNTFKMLLQIRTVFSV